MAIVAIAEGNAISSPLKSVSIDGEDRRAPPQKSLFPIEICYIAVNEVV